MPARRAAWLLPREPPQDRGQDAAVAVVVELDGAVDAAGHLEDRRGAVVRVRGDLHPRPGLDRGDTPDRVRLAPAEAELVRVLAGQELQRQDAHADEIRPVDALEALGNDGADTEEQRALGRPVARRPGAVLAARDHDAGHALRAVATGDVVDEALLAVRQVDRVRTLALAGERVPEADVAEGSADEHLVVPSPRAVRVELQRRHAVLLEPGPGRRPRDDRAGGRDVVRRDRVA